MLVTVFPRKRGGAQAPQPHFYAAKLRDGGESAKGTVKFLLTLVYDAFCTGTAAFYGKARPRRSELAGMARICLGAVL